MNWIIGNSNKMRYHTNLFEITKPFKEQIDNYNWILSGLDLLTNKLSDLPINFEGDYFLLSPTDFKKLVESNTQIIWGVILGVPQNLSISIDLDNLPFVEGNDNIWLPGNLQFNFAEIEIDCFDSSYTIIKFISKELSQKFKNYFEEAIELDKFNQN